MRNVTIEPVGELDGDLVKRRFGRVERLAVIKDERHVVLVLGYQSKLSMTHGASETSRQTQEGRNTT